MFDQPTNLSELADWSGIEQPPHQRRGLRTQFLAFHDGPGTASMQADDGWSTLISVFESPWLPFDLESTDVEFAIYEVHDRWQEVVRGIDNRLPGPAIRPDITGVSGNFVFGRDEWPLLAARIGHGADPGEPATIEAAMEVVFTSAEDEYLPLLAANALGYAVRHNIERMELFGESISTNLWESSAEVVGPIDPNASWDDRAVHARMQTFADRGPATVAALRQLLVERPSALYTARALFGLYGWHNQWSEIHLVADSLLQARQDDATRAELLCWRGDAAVNLGRSAEAHRDAIEADALGRPELLAALDSERR